MVLLITNQKEVEVLKRALLDYLRDRRNYIPNGKEIADKLFDRIEVCEQKQKRWKHEHTKAPSA